MMKTSQRRKPDARKSDMSKIEDQIVVYQPNGTARLVVRIENETAICECCQCAFTVKHVASVKKCNGKKGGLK